MEMPPFWTCIFVVACATAIFIQPMLRYVLVGWRAKRKDIMDGLSPKARLAYFRMFGCSEVNPTGETEACTKFEQLYSRWYGRCYFVIPGILLLLVGLTASAAVVFSVLGEGIYPKNRLFTLPPMAIAALAGAYLWVVNDHINRARRLDFSPADIMWAVLRVVIAVPMGYAFSSFFAKDVGPFIAFGFGAFPLSALISIVRRLTEKRLASEPSPEEISDELIKLQGINKSIVERLSNEDVTTITQMAYCDPVRLTMRSNLTFNFIVDCVNQSLAWLYLSEQLNHICPFGLRGAVEIKYLLREFDEVGTEPEEIETRRKATVLMTQVATAIKQTPETLEFAFRQIADDPYTIFLYEIWDTPAGLES